MRKVQDIVVYSDPKFYSAFPSIVQRPDGELLVAFRRAPNRRSFGTPGNSHCDPNSYLVLVCSTDDGKTWSEDPELIHAHDMGGSQDPCMVQLADGTMLCSSYLWVLVPDKPEQQERRHEFRTASMEGMPCTAIDSMGWRYVFCGGYLIRSEDGGRHWSGPILPPPVPGTDRVDLWGNLLPAYNRGGILEGSDGLLYWAVARNVARHTTVHLMVSEDKGSSWSYRCPIAEDGKVVFNETCLYETAGGNLVAFLRTAQFDDHTAIARSHDRGQSFEPWEDAGFQGHPHHAVRLKDGRVFVVYGYRHEPYGIRARVLDPECRDVGDADEIVLRGDGGTGDLGYPWVTVLPDGRVLAVYYFNTGPETTRFIAGTLLDPSA